MAETKHIVAIVQARMGSERLPGKVMQSIAGKPMIQRVAERVAMVESVDDVLIATTWQDQDDPIAIWAENYGLQAYRGHPTDVLDRYYQAAKAVGAEVIVRVTGDCPLLDPAVSERTVQRFMQADPAVDFVANRLPDHRTYPIGLDTEVCSLAALETAWREAQAAHQREHVMPYLYQSSTFNIKVVDAQGDWGHLRWTVDTAADLEFVRAIYQAFAPREDFGWREVLELLEQRPELKKINESVRHRTLDEIDERFESAKNGKGNQ